jgi:signal peptidase I
MVFMENKDNDSAESKEKTEKINKNFKELLEFIRDLIIIFVFAMFLRTFVFENTRVLGPSMEPTLHDGDLIIVNKLEYYFTDPERGEIIVFPYKGDPSKQYIKRIIALPGEVIDIREGKVYINGELYEEEYILEEMQLRGDIDFPYAIPADTYFVMGDNRNNSSDSRYQDVGTIEKDKIIGHAVFRLWPINKFGQIK